MELTIILVSVALFSIAMGMGFVAGGLFFKIKQDCAEIDKQIDTMNEIICMLGKENAKLKAMNNHSAKNDEKNQEDM